jgi:SAM-dependent methyltransferase
MQVRLEPKRLAKRELVAINQTHWVSPADIRYVSQKTFSADETGKTMGGIWDDLNLPFEDSDLYRGFLAIYIREYPQSETHLDRRKFFRNQLRDVSGACQRENEFQGLLRKIKPFFYKEVGELGQISNHNKDPVISINIGREGDLLLNEGQPYLAMAKLLELPHIPVTITVRHSQWFKFSQEVLDFAFKHRGVYAPLLHPDLKWIPNEHGHERFNLIRDALIKKSGKMLDIGCHWGYFCHRFEEIGFDCTGVEVKPSNFYFLQKLKRAGNKSFQIFNNSILKYITRQNRQYDVVLCLNIFHHFIKSKKGLNELKSILTHLDTKEMYFQPHRQSESQMWNAYWNPTSDEFVAFILEHSNLNKAIYLGHVKGRRPLYQLTI